MDIDENLIVIFRKNEITLKEAIEKCQPGETIEGIPFECLDTLLFKIEKLRNKEYSYSTDRRYGKWRFILFGMRD